MNDSCEDRLSAASRALLVLLDQVPGVSLRSTPGRGPQPGIPAGVRDFMLPAAPRASDIPRWFPGVERSETPGSSTKNVQSPRSGR